MEAECRREIEQLHRFFEDWFSGRVPAEDGVFSRLSGVLADDFLLILPDGLRVGREALLTRLRARHAAYAGTGSGFMIRTRDLRVRLQEGPLCLVIYDEVQEVSGVTNLRVSTALFRARPSAPNGVEWVHVHEVSVAAVGAGVCGGG